MSQDASPHYDAEYLEKHRFVGEFGGWANITKFREHLAPSLRVLDFGCGTGDLLANVQCERKIGVEPNPAAQKKATENGIEVYSSIDELPDSSIDLVISNHALEHTLNPYHDLYRLYTKLAPKGKAVFVIPYEPLRGRYSQNDRDRHLYTWNPRCLGNLFDEAGFTVVESRPWRHKWPPKYWIIARLTGRIGFEMACSLYGLIAAGSTQVRIVATKSG